ncbi:hypothetical protein BpHYR1_039081 [Brachionus plicatilis]|uniref:Uncharacterized protein n=1 Tax=Brachionus plicatilis TaxID=10195 RepID=A0A3M7RZ44_BRAPC|nr:hypothetical protein BpHYR1_039081 [Brachionus plicatilis]
MDKNLFETIFRSLDRPIKISHLSQISTNLMAVGLEIFKLSCISINFLSFAQYSITCRDAPTILFCDSQYQDHVFICFTEEFLKIVLKFFSDKAFKKINSEKFKKYFTKIDAL